MTIRQSYIYDPDTDPYRYLGTTSVDVRQQEADEALAAGGGGFGSIGGSAARTPGGAGGIGSAPLVQGIRSPGVSGGMAATAGGGFGIGGGSNQANSPVQGPSNRLAIALRGRGSNQEATDASAPTVTKRRAAAGGSTRRRRQFGVQAYSTGVSI